MNPFDGWYHKEKKIYDNKENGKTGHYINMMNSNFAIVATAVNDNREHNPRFGRTYAMNLDYGYVSNTKISQEEYREILNGFKDATDKEKIQEKINAINSDLRNYASYKDVKALDAMGLNLEEELNKSTQKIDEIKSEIKEVDLKLNNLSKEKDDTNNSIKELSNKKIEIEEKFKENESKLKELEKTLQDNSKFKETLEEQLAELKIEEKKFSSAIPVEELKEELEKLKKLKGDLFDYTIERDKYSEEVKSLEEKIAKIDKEIEDFEKKIKE